MSNTVFTDIEQIVEFAKSDLEEGYLVIQWDGRFASKVTPEIRIYNYTESVTKELKDTLAIIINNFTVIYNNILEAMLPILKKWGFRNIKENGAVIETIEDLHNARYPDDFFDLLQINCGDIEDGYCYYSLVFRVDYSKYGYGDGMELVCYKDKVVFWSDGNTAEYLFEFREHENEVTYLNK